ncbi:hypothetical protein [Criblamydia sequanensis]|uniref:Secreted protein n=1 Tax=Candidatus Criblamydia sequanensis CRIB-18 TaxID=1437425 RepID=A0A090D188_9BACT|nr:hypothetical protein [Criblamydia sequanensis]CDR33670.1 putative secreted protein [Criblamydia sequanensis CRIB-18]
MKKLEKFFLNNFWLAVFLVIAFFLYETESHAIKNDLKAFSTQLQSIEEDIEKQEKTKQILECKLESLDDFASIEFALINKLGMVPIGYTKLIINEDSE